MGESFPSGRRHSVYQGAASVVPVIRVNPLRKLCVCVGGGCGQPTAGLWPQRTHHFFPIATGHGLLRSIDGLS